MKFKGKTIFRLSTPGLLLLSAAFLLLLALHTSNAQVRRGQNDPVDASKGQPADTLPHGDTAALAPARPLNQDLPDSLKQVILDSATTIVDTSLIHADSLLSVADSLSSDSARVGNKEAELGIKISKDALPAKVVTTARDSAVMDLTSNHFYLYGDANVKYQEIDLKGGKVTFDQSSNVVTAEPERDTAGEFISVQEFAQGTEKFTYDSLQYNFKSKRAIVRNAHSQYGEGYVISEQVKRNPDESIYGWKNIYTTCNLDHPHFGIRANRIKVIPNKIIASGPAYLTIQDIPTPLGLPFGVFPVKQGQSSGFIIPSYTLEGNRGLGFQRGGYYFNLNEYVGLTTTFDIFTKGSWGFAGNTNYVNRYHYNGSFQLGYNYTKTGEAFETNSVIDKDFRVSWTHTQDPKASPGSNFSASVNVVTRGYNSLNSLDAATLMSNSFSSSISYSKSWVGKPYTFTAAFRQSQNNTSGLWDLGLPEINFGVGNFTPFQRKHQVGAPKWYEKISSSYSMRLVNNWKFYDSLLNINDISLRDFNNGIVQNFNIQATYNVLRFFNLNFSVPYTEYWNTREMYLRYDDATDLNDTTINYGFFASRSFSTSASLSTRIYGMKMFRKGKIAGIRHVMMPNIGFTYQPGFAYRPFNYYYLYQGPEGNTPYYRSPYETSPIGSPSPPEPGGSITFGLNNTLGMKVRTNDSIGTKNISILDGFNISGNYNLFADSNKLSNINVTARTSILKIFNISGNAVFDPYVYNRSTRTGRYLASEGKGIANFRSGSIQAGFSYTAEKKNEEEQEEAEKNSSEVARLLQNGGADNYYDFNIPYDFHMNYSMSARRAFWSTANKDSITIDHSLTFGGSFNLTQRWRFSYETAYNFTQKQVGTTSLNISRDLHCWQMSLNLIPFGQYKSFNFLLQVKSTILQDLKLVRRRSYLDNSF